MQKPGSVHRHEQLQLLRLRNGMSEHHREGTLHTHVQAVVVKLSGHEAEAAGMAWGLCWQAAVAPLRS